MYIKDQNKLQQIVKTACTIIGVDHVSLAQLYNDLSLKNTEQILNDPTHPSLSEFLKKQQVVDYWSIGRLLQKKIRTTRYNNSFVPTAIRLYNSASI